MAFTFANRWSRLKGGWAKRTKTIDNQRRFLTIKESEGFIATSCKKNIRAVTFFWRQNTFNSIFYHLVQVALRHLFSVNAIELLSPLLIHLPQLTVECGWTPPYNSQRRKSPEALSVSSSISRDCGKWLFTTCWLRWAPEIIFSCLFSTTRDHRQPRWVACPRPPQRSSAVVGEHHGGGEVGAFSCQGPARSAGGTSTSAPVWGKYVEDNKRQKYTHTTS